PLWAVEVVQAAVDPAMVSRIHPLGDESAPCSNPPLGSKVRWSRSSATYGIGIGTVLSCCKMELDLGAAGAQLEIRNSKPGTQTALHRLLNRIRRDRLLLNADARLALCSPHRRRCDSAYYLLQCDSASLRVSAAAQLGCAPADIPLSRSSSACTVPSCK